MPKSKVEHAKLEKRIEELEEKAQEHLDGWKRAQADYKNLQAETAKAKAQTVKFANEQFIQQLLPLVDYFEYAFNGVPEEQEGESWMTGIKHIYEQLLKFLDEQNVQVIDTIHQPFNPELHESVAEVDGTDHEPGTIVEQTQSGFTMHGTCIRPAKVKIAK